MTWEHRDHLGSYYHNPGERWWRLGLGIGEECLNSVYISEAEPEALLVVWMWIVERQESSMAPSPLVRAAIPNGIVNYQKRRGCRWSRFERVRGASGTAIGMSSVREGKKSKSNEWLGF